MIEAQQAFVSDFITQAFGLPIAHENENYTPTQGTPWVQLRVFPADTTAGDVAANTTEHAGFYQFSLHYPEGEGAMTAKLKAQAIFDAYPVGRRLTYSSKSVRITALQQFDASPQGGWFRVVGRIFYEKD